MISLEYLAGLIDADGGIILHPSNRGKYRKYYPKLKFTNTNKSVLDSIVEQFGGKLQPKRWKNKPSHWAESWDWSLTGNEARELINKLLPFLVIKKEKAEYVLANDEKQSQEGA